jgi:putative endonuclease
MHDLGRPARTVQQRAGDAAEALAADRLAVAGWTVLARNVRVGRRELDIVAVDPGPPAELVVVEVRWRHDRSFGLPEETVDWRKRRHIRKAAFQLLERGLPDDMALPPLPLRIDLVVVEPAAKSGGDLRLRHYRHAL